ncbi:MAG TPA: aminotransferase class III-fold pyridoxal phosphate-dependent enzyme [Streptosporangiaceae bacterium]|nr:aminotransferase class III-fold pyridoxal phosphate-dependent enzyme [Streptosporangiaceae bacterium]
MLRQHREPVNRPSQRGTLADDWASENPRSGALSARARGLLPGGVTHDVRLTEPFPLAVARAAGSRKWDLDGHELVCYVMGHGSLLAGHSHPEVVAAVQEQAARSFHPGACHELESDWAQAVIRLVPSAERVRFTSSGTEASLLALRLARAVTGRGKIVKLAGHFHGWHDQAALGADPPFDTPDTAGLPRDISGSVAVIPADAGVLADVLRARDVAAFILEPSGAAWGTVPLPGGFLAEARRLADETGTLLLFDEVVTGFRWAPGGVQEVAGVLPDLTVLGKVLAGGMPGGAVCGRSGVMDHLGGLPDDPRRVTHPGTHNAHPLSAAAGVAMLGLASSGEAQRHTARLAAALRAELSSVFERCGVAGRAYGESSVFHLLFGPEAPERRDPATLKAGLPRPLSTALHCGMLREGVHLFHGSGFLSTAHSQSDVERTADALAATLPRLAAEGLV